MLESLALLTYIEAVKMIALVIPLFFNVECNEFAHVITKDCAVSVLCFGLTDALS